MQQRNHVQDPRVFKGLAIALVALVMAFGVGKLLAGQAIIAVAVAVIPIAVLLLFRSPFSLFVIYLTILFDGLGWVPVDRLLHIPGLGKISDLIGLAMFAALFLQFMMRVDSVRTLLKSPFYKPIMVVTLYAVWILIYTVFYWHEDPVYAFRVGRSMLIYGLPLLGYVIITKEQHWKILEYLCLLAIVGSFFANIADALIDIPWLENIRKGADRFGVFKAFTETKFISSLFLARYLWMFAHVPSKRNLLKVALVGVPFVFYIFRGLIFALTVGILVMTFFMPVRVRARAHFFLIIIGVSGVFLSIAAASIMSGVSLGEMVTQFTDQYVGQVGQDSSFEYRLMQMRERLPLVRENPWFGIGFLSPYGTVAWGLYYKGYMPLGDVDSGWLDVLMRLGGVGAVVILGYYFLMINRISRFFKKFRRLSESFSLKDQAWMMGTVVVMIQVLIALVSSANITRISSVAAISIGIIKCMKIWEEQSRLIELKLSAEESSECSSVKQ